MNPDDIKWLIAAVGGLVGIGGTVFTILKSSSSDDAGATQAMVLGWSKRVDELTLALEKCEGGRRTMEDKIKQLEDDASQQRLEHRRDLANLYNENDRLRDRVRALEAKS